MLLRVAIPRCSTITMSKISTVHVHAMATCATISSHDNQTLNTTKLRTKSRYFTNYWNILTYWGRDELNISQTTFANVFSSVKMFEFWSKFHQSLFPRFQLTIFQHWFRLWLGAVQATGHYLNQWWLVYRRIYASLGLNELTRRNYCSLELSQFWSESIQKW